MNGALALGWPSLPWLRSVRFDMLFILGLPAVALGVGGVVMNQPALFFPILAVDLWLLGYHHVIATYTRLCFDRTSFREHRALILYLFPAVALVTLLVAWQVGVWAIVTIYFYWQWWHYTRQSWGISRAYRGKDRAARHEDGWLDQAIFYALPVYGILVRSTESSTAFIGLEIRMIPLPGLATDAAGVIAFALLALWVALRIRAAREGRLATVHTLYMLSHFIVFAFAYVVTKDITIGWLIINIWHNAQYILFVWMYNNRRFRGGIDPNARFLSYISQDNRIVLYLVACLAVTGIIYFGLIENVSQTLLSGLVATIVIYQVVNFHHYIVDSLIWKIRTPKLQTTLGLRS